MESYLNKYVKIVTLDSRVYFGIVEEIDSETLKLVFTRKEGFCIIPRSDIRMVRLHGRG